MNVAIAPSLPTPVANAAGPASSRASGASDAAETDAPSFADALKEADEKESKGDATLTGDASSAASAASAATATAGDPANPSIPSAPPIAPPAGPDAFVPVVASAANVLPTDPAADASFANGLASGTAIAGGARSLAASSAVAAGRVAQEDLAAGVAAVAEGDSPAPAEGRMDVAAFAKLLGGRTGDAAGAAAARPAAGVAGATRGRAATEASNPANSDPLAAVVDVAAFEKALSAEGSAKAAGVKDIAGTVAGAEVPVATSAVHGLGDSAGSIRERAPELIVVPRPVGTPGWQEDIGQALSQFVTLRAESAEIRVHPENLGPIQVRIAFSDDQASVLITAPQAATRDALEQALPHLREALAGQGVALADVSVRDDRAQQDAWQKFSGGPDRAGKSGEEGRAVVLPIAPRPAASRLVDTFA